MDHAPTLDRYRETAGVCIFKSPGFQARALNLRRIAHRLGSEDGGVQTGR